MDLFLISKIKLDFLKFTALLNLNLTMISWGKTL